MNIALIGPTGAGKGTIAVRLASELPLERIATGDLFRQNIAARTTLGLKASQYVERGELVPEELVDAMVKDRIRACPPERGLLLDGFPRTEFQARFLDSLFAEIGRRLDGVVLLNLDASVLLRRLEGRLVCPSCHTPYHVELRPPCRPGSCDACGSELVRRHDDDPAQVRARLRVFQRTVGPVLEFYRQTSRLAVVEADAPVDSVRQSVLDALRDLNATAPDPPAWTRRVALPDWHRPLELPPPATEESGLGLVLLGGPGAGKGTLAEALEREFRLPHIATGDLFRENLRQATELGKLAKVYMDRGELVPDEVTEGMVRERLARTDAAEGFILDGFPRTLPQAEALREMLAELGRRLQAVLCLSVPDEEIVRRLSGRLICRECQAPYHREFKVPRVEGRCDACGGELYQRDDDNPRTVRARLKTYHAQTEPLISHYQSAGLLREIDGLAGAEIVAAQAVLTVRELASTSPQDASKGGVHV